MNCLFLLKNSVKNIYRYKSKYIMFGILYLILILAASVCVNVFVRMSEITDNILREYAGVSRLHGTISDMYNLPDRLAKSDYLTLKDIDQIDDIRFLKYNFHTDFIKENVSELKVSGDNDDVFIIGYNMSLLHLAENDFNLESGRMFENDGECVISWNESDIGDKIIVANDDGIYKEFTVTGIQSQNDTEKMIYTTLESAEYFDSIALVKEAGIKTYSINPLIENEKSNLIPMGYEVLVYLDSPETLLNLQSELANIEIYGFSFYFEPLFPNFRPLINLTRGMETNAAGFMIITAFIIICVTIISTVILLNSRKYEIAVLRSAGMKKSRLILSYLIENLIFIWSVTIVSLIITQFISPLITSNVFIGMREFISVDMFENLTKAANPELLLNNIIFVFGGTTAIVMFSLILACVNIIRFEPLKIFGKQY